MTDQNVIKKLLEQLRAQQKIKSAAKCSEIILIIMEYFDNRLTASEINYALELLLTSYKDQKISVINFLIRSKGFSKSDSFSDCNKKVFELIQALAKTHSIKLKPYSKDVVDICTHYFKTEEYSATEKENAVLTIKELTFSDGLSEDVKLTKLVDDLMSVFKQKNPPMRLQQNFYEFLGLISKKLPENFVDNKAAELRNKMINTIESLFKDDKANVSMMLISGAVEGLKNHLVNFSPTLEDDPDFSSRLYVCMEQLSDPDKHSNASNRVAFRNMMKMLHQHGGLHEIPSLLFRDHKMWQKVLVKWISSKAYDDKNAGIHAMATFHQVIADILQRKQSDEDKKILMFFMKYFRDVLESPESQPHEIRIGIRGFGSMAPACKLHLEPHYLSELFDLVMQRTEYSYHTNDRLKRREVLEHLPHYIESLSKIINYLEEFSGIQLESLENIFWILIKDFHYLSLAHHSLVASSMLEAFMNLQKLGGKVLDNVLESVIWKGILSTCDHPVIYELEENFDSVKDWKEKVTYRKYLPLWKLLLSPIDEKHSEISKQIYSHFVKNLFLIIDKIDLSTKKRKFYNQDNNEDVEFFFSDPSLDLEPVRAENFKILYNLVHLYTDVILSQSNDCLAENFISWLELWLEKSIKLSYKHQLVSAFPQLIEIALKVIDRLDYAITVDQLEARRTIEPLSFYIKSMLLVRCQQMSGELQIACLRLVFQVPAVILKDSVEELTQIFIIGFSIGKGLLPLAHMALTCFERIVDAIAEHPQSRRRLLEQILPCLETFLSSSDASETDKQTKRYRKKTVSSAVIETDLMRFKKRILLLLGQFDPDESQLLLSRFEQKLTRDHVTNVFCIKLKCNDDVFPIINLDNIVERVCLLAVSSSERATKIAACELLHGLTLYMMGTNIVSTLSLWKDLCNNLIILGADKDETVRALFEPLLMQMMHHFSHREQILKDMARATVESIMTMICHKGNSGVQDLSARLLREFLIWLEKQTSREDRHSAPIKLVDIFHEMKKMSIETDASRRLGATLAFNNTYRIIRDDELLIDVYWIYLLDVFGMNFKSSEDFSAEFESNFLDDRRFEQVSASMDHLARVFIERSDIFKCSNRDRIRPAGFDGMMLTDVLQWLFKESGSHQYHYRHKCMEMFMKILPACDAKNDFYTSHISVAKVLTIGEENGIAKNPDLKHLGDCQSPIFIEIGKWMQQLLTSLDFYIWIFENDIIRQGEVAEFLQRSMVLNAVRFFLKSFVNQDMVVLVRSINEALINTSQMSCEAKMFNRNLSNIDTLRCIILVRIVDLLTVLMKEDHVAQFLNDNKAELLRITKKLIFKPQRLGFDYKSKSQLLKLPRRIISFVTSVNARSTFEFKTMLMHLLQRKLMKHLNALCQDCEQLLQESSVSVLNINKLSGMDLIVTNLKEQLALSLLGQELLCKTAEVLLKKLFDGIAEVKAGIHRPRYLKPSAKKFATSIMQLCLKIDVFLIQVIQFSFTDEPLKITESCVIRHGEHFMQTYKVPIFELFTSMVTDTIRLFVGSMKDASDAHRLRIMEKLTELNEFMFNRHRDNAMLLNENMDATIAQWPTIIRIALEMDNNLNSVDLALINLTSHMAMVSPIEWQELGQRLEKLQAWLYALLENPKNSLEIKSKGIFLLPFVTSREDIVNEKLMKALNSVQQRHMPLKSHEFPEGSLQRAMLVSVSKRLFTALLTSHSPVIYRFIINVTITDDDYILESKLQSIQVELMEQLTKEEQEVIVNQTYDAFINGGHGPDIRLSFVTRFLLTIMKNCKVDVMMTFMIQKMGAIWTLMDSPLGVDTEQSFVNRCGAFMMIEAFFASVPSETIERGSYFYAGKSEISGKTLIKDLLHKAIEVRSSVTFVVDNPVQQELFRKLQCNSYRALAAIVSNTQTKFPVYNLTLFKESQKNGDIWRHLIDVKRDDLYTNWTQDFEELPRIKEHIISVKELRPNATQNRKYIETVSIFDRSLSQSLTKTDLSYSVVFSNREALEREQQRRELEHQKTMTVQLESTPINDHEVMSVLVGVVHHLHHNITRLDTADNKRLEWVASLAAPLANRDNHKNVRIFIAKLIDNCRDVFKHHAKLLLGPVLAMIADRCVGDKMNFFVTDLVTMLLSWSDVYKPMTKIECDDACALLKFLMENAHHDRNEIFKLNLELIKKLVETWKDSVTGKIPSQTLLNLLQKPIEQEMNQMLRCGIQLNAVVLANEIMPWRDDEQRDLFIKAIVACCHNPNAHVYQAASQLLGMCLHEIIGDAEIIEGDGNHKIVTEISNTLDRIRSKSGSDVNVFLQLLYGIQKSFPRILDRFMTSIKFNIPKVVRKIKQIYLEMYLSRLEIDGNNIYREIIAIGIPDLLKKNEYQLLALHIVNKSLDFLTGEEILKLIDDLSPLANSPKDEVRRVLFEMMIFVVERFRKDPTFDKKKPMRIILRGFTDADKQIQNRVVNFFSVEGELTRNFAERFKELLEFFDPSLEREFLHYASALLLDIPIRHPDSDKPLLTYYDQSKNKNFFEYPISTKINTQRSLPPMFIQSQSKSLLVGDGSIYEQMVRATQCTNDTRKFNPTLDPSEMTQVSSTFNFTATQNSLSFSLKQQYLDRRSRTCSLPEDELALKIARKKEGNNQPDEYENFRQRIVRRDERVKSKEFALRAIERKDFEEAKRKESMRQSREGKKVELYRRYRLGEQPDFFFTDLALLLPLQALAKQDSAIARDIFLSIFEAINAILKAEDESNDTSKSFFASINISVMSILQQTKNSDAFLIGTLLEMAMKSQEFLEISPDVLANVATANNIMVTGVLFLESQLNHLNKGVVEESSEQPLVKRQRIDEDERKSQHWMKLTELYYKMNEYEVIAGIFTEKLSLVPDVRRDLTMAIDFESGGRFVDANQIYQNLISTNRDRNNHEKEFYYQSFFSCLANLSDWREITREIGSQFHSYREVWDDDVSFHKDTLLPHLMKSELRMILENNIDSRHENDAKFNEFINILEEWLNDDPKADYLRNVFPEEIVMLHIVESNYAEGCVEAEKAIRSFADDWSCLEMLDEKLKCLKSARNMSELTNFLNVMIANSPERLEKLYRSWKLSKPKSSDSLVHWGDLLAYRENFYLLIDEDKRMNSATHLADIKQQLIDVAFAQKSCDAVNFMVNGLKDEVRLNPSEEKNVQWKVGVGKYKMLAAEQKITVPLEQMKRLAQGLRSLISGVIKDENSRNFPEASIESFCCASEIAVKLWKISDAIQVPDEYEKGLLKLIDAIDDDNSTLKDHLMRFSEDSLKKARNWAKKYLDEEYSAEKELILAGTFLKLGRFYHHVYASGTITSPEIQLKIIGAIFRAIAYGSHDAKVYIPYILQLADLQNNKLTKEFNKELNMVPEWMFIAYISQMLSNYDFENACYLDELLHKLAVKYPNALYFPFKLSHDNYKQLKVDRGMEKEQVVKINDAVSNPAMNNFIKALQCLVLPDKMLETHYKSFEAAIQHAGAQLTSEMLQRAVKKFHHDAFVDLTDMKGSNFSNIRGFAVKLEQLMKLDWNTQRTEITILLRAFSLQIQKIPKRRHSNIDLHKLCKWLAEYKWCGERDFIEIPGQYSGDFKPFLEQHVKIVRFETQLKIFNSKQSPIEIRIHGSDGKTYSFIIKYGEDVRQDQRIQQALALMSRQLSMDKHCKQNHLSIQTYQVMPINTRCGMLSVVQNAKTINEFIHESRITEDFNEYIPNVRDEFRLFLIGNGNFTSFQNAYKTAVLTRSRQDFVDELTMMEKKFPSDIIRRTLLNSSLTLETYYILRKNFITSLAAMNIAHWLLGIGDRHLSNILIDGKTGRLVGIDFGMAFGAAADSPVPELVPFRLTSQFVNVLEPLGIEGMIRKNMIHVMRCLRDFSSTILICLEVFIKEPTLDWQMRSKMKSFGTAETEVSQASSSWNPESRIAIVQRKLEGANPMKILKDELSIGQVAADEKHFKAYERLVDGDDDNVRRQMNEDGLTVEEQVSCLINMATDKALLACIYLGWDPWI